MAPGPLYGDASTFSRITQSTGSEIGMSVQFRQLCLRADILVQKKYHKIQMTCLYKDFPLHFYFEYRSLRKE